MLGGGTTDAGLPYLVMEYVDGIPVDQFCQQHRLSIEARLQLFREICVAVSYAHRHLVIHRDIKPANILVKPGPEHKLLDFGVAKLLLADEPSSHVTRLEERFMTPEYASPEQIRGGPSARHQMSIR